MGDPKDIKGKGHSWSELEHKLLLRLLVDAISFCDANGKFKKLMEESRILTTLQQKLGFTKPMVSIKIG
ncbi:hypothetical protein YC2023_076491 [Brassica napus]